MTKDIPTLTFWFDLASNYSYLAAHRIEDIAQARGVQVFWRPFLLGPIFKSQGWDSSPFNIYPAKGDYTWRDLEREAAKYGLPKITRPNPFPQNSLLAARLATLGRNTPWMLPFVREVFAAQFQRGEQISNEGHLAQILNTLGEDGTALINQVRTDQGVKDQLRQNTEQAITLGIFGAPSFTTSEGELFWGNDRLEDAINFLFI